MGMIMETQDLFGSKEQKGDGNGHTLVPPMVSEEAAFGYPRDFLNNRFVYVVISPRARGMSIGVNMNPIVKWNFNRVYCEVVD